MKINFTTLLVSLFILSACNSQKANTKSSEMKNKIKTSKMDNTHTIELKKGELLVVAIADQKTGKEELLQEYFNTIMPTAMQNGLSFIGQLHIDKIVKAKNFMPNNFIGLFKWTNMESVMAFSKKFPPEKIKQLRIPIWNEFKGHVIAIQEDFDLNIDENKVYEVKTLWTKDVIKTNSISQNGGKVLLNQPISAYEDLYEGEAPNQILIIEWNNEKNAETFNKMNMLKPQKEEAFYTHFTLFP